ncbi:MAG: hypothetical protein AAF708_16175 [Deinococcota bacterium]
MLVRSHRDIFSILSIILSIALVILAFVLHNVLQTWLMSRYGNRAPHHQPSFSPQLRHHIDMLGAISLLLLGIGWAKPVTLDPAYQQLSKRLELVIWYSGPAAFLIFALLYNLLSALTSIRGWLYLDISFGTAGYYLLIHVIAHLLPIWLFDGAKGALIWGDRRIKGLVHTTKNAYPAGTMGFLLIIILVGIDDWLFWFNDDFIEYIIRIIR